LKKTAWVPALAVVIYTAMLLFSDAGSVGEAVSSMKTAMVPLFLGLSLVSYFFRFLKWWYFLERVGVRVPVRESLGIFLAGFSMTVSPGKLGELLKCYMLKRRRGIPVSRTSPVVVMERVTDLLSMMIIALAGLVMTGHRSAFAAVVAGGGMTAIIIVFLAWEPAFRLLERILLKIRFFRSRRDGLENFRVHCSGLLDISSLAVSVPLGVLAWGTEAMILCLVSVSLGVEPGLPVGAALLAHSSGTIAGAVSMIPGGLGLTEVTIGAILGSYMSGPDATAVTLLMRFATLWFAVALGAVVFAFVRKGEVRDGSVVK